MVSRMNDNIDRPVYHTGDDVEKNQCRVYLITEAIPVCIQDPICCANNGNHKTDSTVGLHQYPCVH